MTACPECGAQDQRPSARFCGRCGALLPSTVEAPTAPPQGGRRWAIVVGTGAVLLALVVLVVGVRLDRPTPPAWERTARVDLPPADDTVTAAGAGHVLVGRVVLPTAPDAPATLRALPTRVVDGALDGDRWALFEGGALVTGSIRDGVEDRTRARTSAAVGGTARAWAGGDPVLVGEDGHMVRLGPGGVVVWWTERPVTAVVATGERWLLGEDARGQGVAIDVRDGALTALGGRPLAVVDDLAVVRRDDVVVGLDLPEGTRRWEWSGGNGVWRVVAGSPVLEGPTSVVRIDPETGSATDEVLVPAGVAVGGGAVARRGDRLEAIRWDGSEAWTLPLDDRPQHRLAAVDAGRVALRSRTSTATTVAVLDAADGRVLGEMTVPPAPLPAAGAAEGVAGFVLPRRAVPLVLDVATGAVVDRPTPPLRRDRIDTDDGSQVIADGLVSVRAAGALGVWRTVFDAPVAAAPVLRTTGVDVATTDGTVQRLDPASGAARWLTRLDALPTALAGAGAEVLVGTADGRVVVVDDGGRVTRTIDVGAPVAALAATEEGLVVVTADGVIRGYVRT